MSTYFRLDKLQQCRGPHLCQPQYRWCRDTRTYHLSNHHDHVVVTVLFQDQGLHSPAINYITLFNWNASIFHSFLCFNVSSIAAVKNLWLEIPFMMVPFKQKVSITMTTYLFKNNNPIGKSIDRLIFIYNYLYYYSI